MMFEKPTKIRSKKITQSAKGESCTLRIPGACNRNPDTVVFCHAPSPDKGTGSKSDDFWGAYGCSGCHSYMDNRMWNQLSATWFRAIFETQKKLFKKGILKL